MEWKLFLSTFLTIFLAEMGDKTQLAAFTIGAGNKSVFTVWIAVVLALIFAGSIGVFSGKWIGQFVNPRYINWVGGSLFIIIGVLMILKKPAG